MSRTLSSIANLQALTEVMRQAAVAQEWENLADLEQQRHALLRELPADLAPHLLPPEIEQARRLLELCRQTDREIQALIGERQRELRILLCEPPPL